MKGFDVNAGGSQVTRAKVASGGRVSVFALLAAIKTPLG